MSRVERVALLMGTRPREKWGVYNHVEVDWALGEQRGSEVIFWMNIIGREMGAGEVWVHLMVEE